MTKYKTNAQKLKFFNDAKAARIDKARVGMMVKRGFSDSNSNEPQGPDPDRFYTNTTKGELPSRNPSTMYTNTTKGEINNPLHRKMWLKSQSQKRK